MSIVSISCCWRPGHAALPDYSGGELPDICYYRGGRYLRFTGWPRDNRRPSWVAALPALNRPRFRHIGLGVTMFSPANIFAARVPRITRPGLMISTAARRNLAMIHR